MGALVAKICPCCRFPALDASVLKEVGGLSERFGRKVWVLVNRVPFWSANLEVALAAGTVFCLEVVP